MNTVKMDVMNSDVDISVLQRLKKDEFIVNKYEHIAADKYLENSLFQECFRWKLWIINEW